MDKPKKKPEPQIEKACVICGASFMANKYSAKSKKTCSHACRVKASALGHSTGVTTITRPCPTCGAEFSVVKGQEKNNQYCSAACGHKARAAMLVTQVDRTCPACGTVFKTRKSSTKKACSVACAGVMRRIRPRQPYCTRSAAAEQASLRRAKQRKATPVWADRGKILAMYKAAADLSAATGIRFEVDHIVPITHRKVTGLHWEGNMRIVPSVENQRKGNRHWPDMP